MRPGPAYAVCAAALVLGGLTGVYLLPEGGRTPVAGPPATPVASSPGTASPAEPSAHGPAPSPTRTPAPSTPAPRTRLDDHNLLTVQSFADQSVTVTFESQKGVTDPASAVSACVADDAHEARSTLADITGHEPALEGLWGETATDDTVRQVVAVADDSEDATGSVTALVESQADCQRAEKGHWVYGPLHTDNRSSTLSSSWIGYYPEQQNTAGRAPSGVEPCGGLAFARNGARFSIITVYMCLDQVQMAGLADAAAFRLA